MLRVVCKAEYRQKRVISRYDGYNIVKHKVNRYIMNMIIYPGSMITKGNLICYSQTQCEILDFQERKCRSAGKTLHVGCQELLKRLMPIYSNPLPKMKTPGECSNHRTTSLIVHDRNGFFKIIIGRMQQIFETEIPDIQVIFVEGRGTREQMVISR